MKKKKKRQHRRRHYLNASVEAKSVEGIVGHVSDADTQVPRAVGNVASTVVPSPQQDVAATFCFGPGRPPPELSGQEGRPVWL